MSDDEKSHLVYPPAVLVSYLKVEKFRYEYFMDVSAPAQIITAPAQIITAPTQLITAPAQPPATGAAMYTALFLIQIGVRVPY